MITIVRGSSKLVVTRGAYEEQYKKLGYQIASENKGAAKKVAPLLEKKEEKQVEESSFKKDEEERGVAGRAEAHMDGKAERRLPVHIGKGEGEHRRVPRGGI